MRKNLNEANFGGYHYRYDVRLLKYPSSDSIGESKLLGGNKTIEGALKIAKNQIDSVLSNPWMDEKEKSDWVSRVVITDSDNNNVKVARTEMVKLRKEAQNKINKKPVKESYYDYDEYRPEYTNPDDCVKAFEDFVKEVARRVSDKIGKENGIEVADQEVEVNSHQVAPTRAKIKFFVYKNDVDDDADEFTVSLDAEGEYIGKYWNTYHSATELEPEEGGYYEEVVYKDNIDDVVSNVYDELLDKVTLLNNDSLHESYYKLVDNKTGYVEDGDIQCVVKAFDAKDAKEKFFDIAKKYGDKDAVNYKDFDSYMKERDLGIYDASEEEYEDFKSLNESVYDEIHNNEDIKELMVYNVNEALDAYYEVLKNSDTVAGEIIRAIKTIEDTWNNPSHKDYFYEDDVAGSAMNYLMKKINDEDFQADVEYAVGEEDDLYSGMLGDITKDVLNYLENHKELFDKKESDKFNSYPSWEVDRSWVYDEFTNEKVMSDLEGLFDAGVLDNTDVTNWLNQFVLDDLDITEAYIDKNVGGWTIYNLTRDEFKTIDENIDTAWSNQIADWESDFSDEIYDDDVDFYEDEEFGEEFDESLNEDSLHPKFKQEIKNQYKQYDKKRDKKLEVINFIKKFIDLSKYGKTDDEIMNSLGYDDNFDEVRNDLVDFANNHPDRKNEIIDGWFRLTNAKKLFYPEKEFRPEISKSLERKDFPYYVTFYSEYPAYHPEEGGYYQAIRTAISSKGFNTLEDAWAYADEEADGDDSYWTKNDYGYVHESDYIGDEEYIMIEPRKSYLSFEKEWEPYS